MDALAPIPELPLAAPPRLARFRSDAALAERFAAGDDAAFAALYERHRASVLAVCIGVLGSRHDAEDAAQESFASLAIALRAAPPRELRPWLARVARNAAIDVARRRRVRVTPDGELGEHAAVAGGPGGELEIVLAGLRELPEAQRTALLMRELAGHSYAEIGALLEVDEEVVRGLIARARIGLRNYREATELPCATARAVLAAEHDGRRRPREVRRHLRACPGCRAYRQSLRADARALRALVPVPAGGLAGGTAVAGGLAAKGVVVGATVTQVTAACAVSVCAVGGIVLLAPHHVSHHPRQLVHRTAAERMRPRPDGLAVTLPSAGAVGTPASARVGTTKVVARSAVTSKGGSSSANRAGSADGSGSSRHRSSHGDGSGDRPSGGRQGADSGSGGPRGGSDSSGGGSGGDQASGSGAAGAGSGSGSDGSTQTPNAGDSQSVSWPAPTVSPSGTTSSPAPGSDGSATSSWNPTGAQAASPGTSTVAGGDS